MDPELHPEGTPRAIELAAINGHIDAFSLLAARLRMDSQNDEWFQMGQVGSLSSSSRPIAMFLLPAVGLGSGWER